MVFILLSLKNLFFINVNIEYWQRKDLIKILFLKDKEHWMKIKKFEFKFYN